MSTRKQKGEVRVTTDEWGVTKKSAGSGPGPHRHLTLFSSLATRHSSLATSSNLWIVNGKTFKGSAGEFRVSSFDFRLRVGASLRRDLSGGPVARRVRWA